MPKWLQAIINFFKPAKKIPVIVKDPDEPSVVVIDESLPTVETTDGFFPDISRYEPCDFEKFDGDDMIFKATDGGSWIDPKLNHHMAGCASKKIKSGVYHFYRVGVDPIDQAKHFIKSVGLENLTSMHYEPILDYETVTNKRVGPLQSEADMKLDREDAKKFLRYIYEQTGRKCMFYTYESLLAYLELDSSFKDLCSRLWIARYGKKPTRFAPWSSAWAWQYSDGEYSDNPPYNDNFKGIGRCDANIIL
jgi:GH25 family lysozyme M1 (1,4-beta-N-acetylmuramidase)